MLLVKITGLCLFVPEPAKKRVHVLIPATGTHGNHGGHGGATVEKHVLEVKVQGKDVQMQGSALDLTGTGGSGHITGLPSSLLNVTTRSGVTIPADRVGDAPDTAVAARITLPAAKQIVTSREVCWKVGNDEVWLTHELMWIVPDVKGRGWNHRPLRKPDGQTVDLSPAADGNGVLRLNIRNTVVPEPVFKLGDPADHVDAYYKVLGKQAEGPFPHLNQDPLATRVLTDQVCRNQKACEDGQEPIVGGDPFNCMLAQTDPPPP